MWCIGTLNGAYLAALEDVLDLYAQPPVPGTARLCFDERPCQLLDHVLTPLPAKPGFTEKQHQEYRRQGVCNVLLAYDIDTGQRYVQVTATKTKADYAHFLDWLEQTHYPDAQRLQLVQDNYATHTYGALYEHLPVVRAGTLRQKLDFHYTPKHGSWLNMAGIEFSALARQCLDRRIGSQQLLETEAQHWVAQRNAAAVKVNWSFTTDKARDKLQNRYAEVTKNNSRN